MTTITATANRYFPKVRDRKTGKQITVRVVVRRGAFFWTVGGYTQEARVTLTFRKGAPRYSVELLTIPFVGVPWAPKESPEWKSYGPTMTDTEFRSFLRAQKIDADEVVRELYLAIPE